MANYSFRLLRRPIGLLLLASAILTLSLGCARPLPDPQTVLLRARSEMEIDDRYALCEPRVVREGSTIRLAGWVELAEHRAALERSFQRADYIVDANWPPIAPYRFSVVAVDRVYMIKTPIDQPGDRDNLTELVRGDLVFILPDAL
ncbi:MAG TPA: hypothetical protein PKB10_09310, partial [Tepidisphaeraceae bacterium]|nr:hypothetical protein [Tepidisphaeraceae bacterium]